MFLSISYTLSGVKEFASGLHETYALEDLQKYNCEMSVLLNNHTPQEILRSIRRSVNSEMTSDDVTALINSWSQNEAQMLGGKYGR
ncbi:MAG: hypothetical protein PHQ89_02510 [Bacilli bacterium]|nr:hypothetical protein [Bacilli bacterium]